MSNVVASGIKSLTLTIEDQVFEVTSFTSTWQVNIIPSCELSLAVGYNAFTSDLAGVHTGGDTALRRAKATVNIELVGEQKAGYSWPTGSQVIFEGYVHAVRPMRSVSGATVGVTLYHWLSDLNTSHAGFGKFSPSTPWDIFKTTPFANTWGMTDYLFRDEETPVLMEEIYSEDLADMFFEALEFSLKDLESTLFREDENGEKPKPHHEKAIEVLNKIENLGCKLGGSIAADSQPLNAGATLELLGSIAHNRGGGSTAWSKIIAFCNLFQLGIVPAIEDVYIAPMDPGSTDFAIDIGNNEIDLGQGTGFEMHLPRGVMMYPDKQVIYNLAVIPAEGEGLSVQTLGQFIVPDAPTNPEGPIDMIPPPPIFNTEYLVGESAEGTGGGGTLRALTAVEISDDSYEKPEGVMSGDADNTPVYPFADDWCKNYYWNYVYARRQQTVNSVLRFDISPGTIVRVDISQASVMGSSAGDLPGFAGNTIYGTAERIIYSISADSNSISTIILIKYLKSEKDAELAESQGANDNPLFDASFGSSAMYKPLHNTLGNL